MTSHPRDLPTDVRDDLTRRFIFHATNAYRGASPENSSPLYEQLALGVASDPEVLQLLVGLDPQQQFANLLLGAVHFLLLGGIEHPLRDFYRSLTPTPRPAQEAYPYFHAFCLEHREQIRRVVTTHSVQTNEVGRCTSLLPAFGLVAAQAHGQPLALVELSTSAGLNLLWDAYGYDYGQAGRSGDPWSPVQLACTPRGDYSPPLPAGLPTVLYRVGIDLNPLDVADPTARQWLQALIWPEHRERAQILEAALDVARRSLPPLVAGDLAEELPTVLADVPREAILCIFHSYTLNHCTQQTRDRLDEILTSTARDRDLFRISVEYHAPGEHPRLVLFTYQHGKLRNEHLAFCESHGRWIEWLQPGAGARGQESSMRT